MERNMETPESLRRLATWYRSVAGFGQNDSRDWRLEFADDLERRATELEQAPVHVADA